MQTYMKVIEGIFYFHSLSTGGDHSSTSPKNLPAHVLCVTVPVIDLILSYQEETRFYFLPSSILVGGVGSSITVGLIKFQLSSNTGSDGGLT